MKAIADICIVPVGVGVSLSGYIAACERILIDAGLKVQLHANGTNVEGDWDSVFGALKTCHEKLHKMGVPRISTVVHIGTRTDRDQSMADKVLSVEQKLQKTK